MHNILSEISGYSSTLRTQLAFFSVLLLGLMVGACDANDSDTNLPTASFSTSEEELNEGATTVLTVKLDEAFSEDVLIPFTVSSPTDSTDLVDYVITSSPITIFADSTTAVIEISAIEDDLIEGADTLFISLEQPTNAMLGEPLTLMLTILDND